MNTLRNYWAIEPARITGAVVAILALAVAFGAPIDDRQQAAILGAVGAIIALVQAELTRSQVTPTSQVGAQTATPTAPADLPEQGDLVAGPATDEPDGTPVDVEPTEPTAGGGL